jgi:hypothetical protein
MQALDAEPELARLARASSRSAIPTMRSRVRSDTPSRPFSATDTVLIETPASRATSVMLTRRARSPAGRGLAGIGPAVRAGMR